MPKILSHTKTNVWICREPMQNKINMLLLEFKSFDEIGALKMPWTFILNEPYLIANWICIFFLLEIEFLKMSPPPSKILLGRNREGAGISSFVLSPSLASEMVLSYTYLKDKTTQHNTKQKLQLWTINEFLQKLKHMFGLRTEWHPSPRSIYYIKLLLRKGECSLGSDEVTQIIWFPHSVYARFLTYKPFHCGKRKWRVVKHSLSLLVEIFLTLLWVLLF